MTTLSDEEQVRWRDAVLTAMDEIANELWACGPGRGADDADLPDLFKALDRQALIVKERYSE
jgi:hypothetical protein